MRCGRRRPGPGVGGHPAHGDFSGQPFYRGKKLYGGLGTGELRRLKQFEDENRKLKQLEHSRIDILANNAGINRPFLTMVGEDCDTVLDVDLNGVFSAPSGGAADDPPELRQNCQYLLCARQRHHAAQHGGIARRRLRLCSGEGGGDSTHQDARAGDRPPRHQRPYVAPGTFVTPITRSTRTPEEVEAHIAHRKQTMVC